MQTFLIEASSYRSAESLDPKRLFSQVYEGIHILASLLRMEDALVNPKRSVINHPAAQLWVGHERGLYLYTWEHFARWAVHVAQCSPHETINYKNLKMLKQHLVGVAYTPTMLLDLIPDHRRSLLARAPEFYTRYTDWQETKEYTWTTVRDHYGIEGGL